MSSKTESLGFKQMTRRAAIGAVGIAGGSSIWAVGIEPNLLTTTYKELKLSHWPKALDRFRIAQLTDLHYRPGPDDSLITKLVAKLEKEKPDIITLTGDYVIEDPSTLPELFHQLRNLSPTHGIFACPGNHDRWHCSSSQLRKEIEAIGASYLQNQGTQIHIKGESIFMNGLDSIWAGHPDPRKSWQGHQKNQPVISLVHEPDPFDHLHLTHPLDLQLSGHTHGGQCRVPLIGYAPARVKFGRKFISGHYQRKQAHLFVGRGLGTVGPRVRFACSPELVILTLRAS